MWFCSIIPAVDKKKKKVVYIEDSPSQRKVIGDFLTDSLANNLVEVDVRKDLKDIRKEIDSGDLPDVLISDDWIETSGEGVGRGVEIAEEILRKAQEIGKDILVVTLLCSNPEEARKYFKERKLDDGTVLSDIVSSLDKVTEAGLCGLFVANVLKKGKRLPDGSLRTFENWLQKEGITRISEREHELNISINSHLVVGAGKSPVESDAFEGEFYQSSRTVIEGRIARIKGEMSIYSNYDEMREKK